MKYLLYLFFSFILVNPQNDLGLKLQVGEIYPQNVVSNIIIIQKINGVEQKTNMEISGRMNFKVKGIQDNEYLMAVSYSSLKMKMNSPMGEMTVSTENGSRDVFSKVMSSMIGKEFSVKMQKTGFISDIKGIDNVFSGVFSSFPDIPESQKKQVLAQLKQAYGEKAFKGNIEMITAIFPDKEVAIGESWDNSVNLESGMSGVMNNKFTLAEIESDTVIINGVSKITTADKEAYVQTNGMPTKYDLTGKATSIFRLDPETNWIIEGIIEQKISGNFEIQDNPNLPGGMKIPMVMNNKMIVK